MTNIERALAERINKDQSCSKLLNKVDRGNATYNDARVYAHRVGSHISELLKPYSSQLEGVTYDEAAALLRPIVTSGYGYVSKLAKRVQEILNEKAGINLDAITSELNPDRINNLIYKLAGEGQDGAWMLGKDVMSNITMSAVTDSIEANADLQREAGLASYIQRNGSNCCEWCSEMSGRYIYGEEPEGFFRVHKDCTCEIIFQPAKRDWKRITYTTGADGKMTKNTTSTA